MKRRLLNLLTLLSLLLLVGVGVLWVRSHFVRDRVLWRNVNGARWVETGPGDLIVGVELANWAGWPTNDFGLRYERDQPRPTVEHVVRMLVLNVGPRDTFEQWQGVGFGWWRWRPASRASLFARLVVPLWAFAVGAALLPSWRGVRRWRRSWRRPGVCRACGYDLRATPGRCPECGAVPEGVKR
jgi:hypothetical protein